MVLIIDLCQQQRIQLYLADHVYTTSINLKSTAQVWLAGYAGQLLSDGIKAGVKRALGDGREMTSLGERRIEGVEMVGSMETFVSGRTFEKWYSLEIDLIVESKQHQPAGPVGSETHVGGSRWASQMRVCLRSRLDISKSNREQNKPRAQRAR